MAVPQNLVQLTSSKGLQANNAQPNGAPSNGLQPKRGVAPANGKPRAEFKSLELGRKEEFVLTGLEIGLSSNCNFRCDYCCAYNLNDKLFMTAERIIGILEDAPHLTRVKLSGGEVLIYYDECLEVVEYCTSRGLQTQINTNGSLLNEEKLERLEAAGLGCLHYSFNFTDRKEFAAYYKQPEKMFDRIEENIRISAKSEIDTVLESVIFKSTEFSLNDIHHHIHGLGVRKHEIQNGIPIAKNDWEEVLPQDRVEAVIERLIQNRHPDMTMYFSCVDVDPCGTFYPKVMSYLQSGQIHFPSCVEGRNQLHLHSNGDVLICELGHPKVIGSLVDGVRLNELLTNKPQELVDFLERRNTDKCSCTIRTLVQPQ